KIMGEGHIIQKLDIFSNKVFKEDISEEYLQKKYDEHFNGRVYKDIVTYLIITKRSKSSKYVYNEKYDREFIQKIQKVEQLLQEAKFHPSILKEAEIQNLTRRILMMDFSSHVVSMDNIETHNTHLKIGEKFVKCLSLVDIDNIDLPQKVSPYIERTDKEAIKGFP